MPDNDDLDQFDDLEDDLEGETGSADGEDAETDAPPADDKSGATESKRINDLTSKWQKAEARAQKLSRQLARQSESGGEKDQAEKPDPEREQWIQMQREFARERALNTDPRLIEYDLTADQITGDTPAEIKASVKSYIDLIDAIETKARTKVLIEHGLSPEVPGGGAPSVGDVGSLSDEDFEKLVRRQKARA